MKRNLKLKKTKAGFIKAQNQTGGKLWTLKILNSWQTGYVAVKPHLAPFFANLMKSKKKKFLGHFKTPRIYAGLMIRDLN